MVAATSSVARSGDHFRAHRSRMVDAQGSITSRSETSHDEITAEFLHRHHGLWSNHFNVRSVKVTVSVHVRNTSSFMSRSRFRPGGWIHPSRRPCQTLRRDSMRGCSANTTLTLSQVCSRDQSLKQLDSFVSSNGVKASHSRKSPSIHGSHLSWRSMKASSSTKVIDSSSSSKATIMGQ